MFLATVVATQSSHLVMLDISIVREFANVFLNEVPYLPPVIEIDLGMDVLPSIALFLEPCTG